jgi:hypothetical protein
MNVEVGKLRKNAFVVHLKLWYLLGPSAENHKSPVRIDDFQSKNIPNRLHKHNERFSQKFTSPPCVSSFLYFPLYFPIH